MLNILYIWILICFILKVNTKPTDEAEAWAGKWFPRDPSEKESKKKDLSELFSAKPTIAKQADGSWTGKWFPRNPTYPKNSFPSNKSIENGISSQCDDGRTNIDIDFDPNNLRHNHKYLCLDHKIKYKPDYATSPVLKEHIIPPAYRAPLRCMDESIEYEERIPTFGPHRHVYPYYGEYKYLPIQRWIHTLEFGAIVMLYHPCANQMQVEKLRNTLNNCLYRHVITPSTQLLPKTPLALVAWGKSLEMSVIDVASVVSFLKDNAKKGPQKSKNFTQGYNAGLVVEAKLVTDELDTEICANINL